VPALLPLNFHAAHNVVKVSLVLTVRRVANWEISPYPVRILSFQRHELHVAEIPIKLHFVVKPSKTTSLAWSKASTQARGSRISQKPNISFFYFIPCFLSCILFSAFSSTSTIPYF
jgi:hypothetical protein